MEKINVQKYIIVTHIHHGKEVQTRTKIKWFAVIILKVLISVK